MKSKISAVILADSINEHASVCRGNKRYANYQGWESYRHILGL